MKKTQKLSTKLILGIGISSIIGLVVLFILGNTHVRNIVSEQVRTGMENDLTYKAAELNSWFDNFLTITRAHGVAASQTERHMFEDLAVAMGANFRDDGVTLVWVGVGDGEAYNSNRNTPAYPWRSFNAPWFRNAVAAGGEAVINMPHFSSAELTWVASTSQLIGERDGYPLAVTLLVDLDTVLETLYSFEFPGNGYAFLLTADGDIISHPNAELNPPEATAAALLNAHAYNIADVDVYSGIASRILAGERFISFTGADGINYFVLPQTLQAAGWHMVNVVPMSAVYGPVNNIILSLMIGFAIVLIMLAVVIMISIRAFLGTTVSRINSRIFAYRQVADNIAKTGASIESEQSLLYASAFSDTSFGLNKITEAFDENMLMIVSIVEDIANLHKEQTRGNYRYLLPESGYDGAYGELMRKINERICALTESRTEVLECISKIVDGDFSADVRQFPGDEAYINDIVNGLRDDIRQAQEAVSQIAQHAQRGELQFRLDTSMYKGAWIDLADALNKTVQGVNEPLDMIGSVMHKLQEGEFNRIDSEFQGAYKSMADTLNTTISDISSYIEELNNVLADMAAGDLQGTISRQYVGSFDSIKNSVNSILTRLNETVADIYQVAEAIYVGTDQLSQSSYSLAEGASKQMRSVQSLTESIEKIDERSKDNAANAQKAAELAAESKENAEKSNEEMHQLLTAMDKINQMSDKISTVVKTIDDIAFKTNLLALNAAVEAARAGEHGKGFSVVAEEVRSLAAGSSRAAQETSELIQTSIQSVQEGMLRANETATSLEKIVSNVMDVSDVIGGIYESSVRQTTAIHSIHNDLNEISNIIQNEAAASEETAASAQGLDEQANILKKKLAFFKIKA